MRTDLESKFYAEALAKFKPEEYTAAGFVSSALVAEQVSSVSLSVLLRGPRARARAHLTSPLSDCSSAW